VAREGWQGWDEYAPFYDWENARTLGRRDVGFWTRVAQRVDGRVLELGCGTGRISKPLAEAGVELVGIDRSAEMLARLKPRAPHERSCARVRGDIRNLPFADESFVAVIAPYGVLQSLTQPRDLATTLQSASRVLRAGGLFGIDLVPDVPNWREYENRVQMRGRAGTSHLTLVESVRQDRRRHLTTFEQCYVERRNGETREHRFELTFRTVSVAQMTKALSRAGFEATAVLGDYNGRAWDARADVWIILAEKK
jgi:ubiquinone/menaquinone biosynthesis C-methylase UbiE